MRSALLSALLLASGAQAASPAESRDASRAGMEAAVEVNPFGPESHGVALVTLTAQEGTDPVACVLDKRTRRAEPAAPFAPPPEG